MKKLLSIFIPVILALTAYRYYNHPHQPLEIHFRHSLRGDLGQALEEVVDTFNKSNPSYKVFLEYGGDYNESFAKTFQGKKATHIRQRPHLLMVAEFNTLAIKKQEGDYIPLYRLLDGDSLDLVPVIKEFYTFKENDVARRLHSLPFNCSAPILYYNKDVFKKVGLPDKAPETWEDMERYAKVLKDHGYAAYLLEHFSVVHNIPYATKRNGFDGDHAKLLLAEEPFVQQLEQFTDWQQKGFYVYGTRQSDVAEEKFFKQECAMLLQGQHRLVFLKDKGGFDIGVGTYPYWKNPAWKQSPQKNSPTDNSMENTPKSTPQEPFALNVGGTSIWVLTGRLSTGLSTGGSCRKISAAAASRKTPIEGIKDFLAYLTSDSVQTFWHQRTGYLPTTLGAYRQTQASGFYQANLSVYMAVKQVIERPNQNLPNGIRLQNYAEIREKIIDAIEDVLLKGKPAQETLDQLVRDSDSPEVPGSDAPLPQ